MEDIIKKGIEKGLIALNNDESRITYYTVPQSKSYKYTDPEEKVRAVIFLQLIFKYGYPIYRIQLEVQVPRRTPNDWADIVIFDDDECKSPYIVVECKHKDVTEQEFLQGIEQGFGNANSLKAHYLLVTSIIKELAYNVADFKPLERVVNRIPQIPHFGQTGISVARYYKGGVDEDGNIQEDIKVISEDELTRVFGKAHQALWAGGKRDPSEAFDELDKIIFCKIRDERALRKKGEPYDMQLFKGEKPSKLLERVKAIYKEGEKKEPEVFSSPIKLDENEATTIVEFLQGINLHKTDLDSKGRAFESFIGSNFRGEFGQYFTPRQIVKFIVDVLPITNEDRVLDTSCGSGGFLLYALDKIRKQADKMADDGYFEKDSKEHFDYWHNFAEQKLFGIEISDKISRTAKMNMIIHDDGHTNIINCDGLLDIANKEHKDGETEDERDAIDAFNKNTIESQTKNKNFKPNSFKYIITNPPFGSSIKATEHAYMKNYRMSVKQTDWLDNLITEKRSTSIRANQSTEVLFIEQCWKFLEPHGILAIVIPDSILTNSSMQYVRTEIEEKFRIIAVVSLPQFAFSANKANVKSSVMFLRKNTTDETDNIISKKLQIQSFVWEQPTAKKEIRKLQKECEAKISLLPRNDSYKEEKNRINTEYKIKIDKVKDIILDAYAKQCQNSLSDYPIFMAIAENIGYDATGRLSSKNDLEDIAKELKRFIQQYCHD